MPAILMALMYTSVLVLGQVQTRCPDASPAACTCLLQSDGQGRVDQELVMGCVQASLTSVPVIDLSVFNITGGIVKFNKNTIAELPAGMLALTPTMVMVLDFSDNVLTRISDDAFRNFPRLTYLALGSNLLTELAGAVLAHTPVLESLNLNSNRLAAIPVLPVLANMRELFVVNNKVPLATSRAQLRNVASTLESFSLESARLPAGLPTDLLRDCSALLNANLDDLGLTALPPDFFHPDALPKLRVIRLGNNKITQFPFSASTMLQFQLKNLLMAGNPSVCVFLANKLLNCTCASGFSNNDGTFCEKSCDLAALPVNITTQSRRWLCSEQPAVFSGGTCFSSCFMLGPGLRFAARMNCSVAGVFFNVATCKTPTLDPESKHSLWFENRHVTWNEAMQTAQLFSFNGAVGQLATSLSAARNRLLWQLAKVSNSSAVWLAAVREEFGLLHAGDDVVLATGVHRGKIFYNGHYDSAGEAVGQMQTVAPFNYSNFAVGQPGSDGGALKLDMTAAEWTFVFKGGQRAPVHPFIVEFDPALQRPWSPDACGVLGFCICTPTNESLLQVFCAHDSVSGAFPVLFPSNTVDILVVGSTLTSFVVPHAPGLKSISISTGLLPSSRNVTFATSDVLPNLTALALPDNLWSDLASDAFVAIVAQAPHLASVDLQGNQIRAVSDFVLQAFMSNVTWFDMRGNPSICTIDLANRRQLRCNCSAGYATNPDFPTFCVEASVYRRCAAALTALVPSELEAVLRPRLTCFFSARNTSDVTCAAACSSDWAVRVGSFECLSNGSTTSAGVACVPVTAPPTVASGPSVVAIAGATAGSVVASMAVWLLVWLYVRRLRKARESSQQSSQMVELERLLSQKVEQTFALAFAGHFSQDELLTASKDFAALEVPRKSVLLERLIGAGQSGDVHVGRVTTLPPNGAVVAIKQCRTGGSVAGWMESPDVTAAEEALQLEARLLHQLRHKHIVRVVAMVTQSLPTCVCFELMANGDLKTYLRACRPALRVRKEDVTPADMVGVLVQVSSALAYLEQHSVVHRDVAARNVLVGASLACVKLGDFGATRVLGDAVYYRQGSVAQVPVKWLAPEALLEAKYTSKSDVWAFGVLAFEVTSYAMTPYGALGTQEVMQELQGGYRLPAPPACPPDLYGVMLQCWAWDAAQRPTLSVLVRVVQGLCAAAPAENDDTRTAGGDLVGALGDGQPTLDADACILYGEECV